MTTTQTREKVSFIDATGKRAVIELGITHRNGYPEFTASGEYDGSLGQCNDSIKPRTEAQTNLLNTWNTYHLNGTNAGTKKQTAVLKKCDSKEYTERKEFLSMHKIDGEPLTAIDAKRIKKATADANEKLNTINSKLAEVDGFREEWRKAKTGWNRSEFPEVIKALADPSGFGDFKFEKSKEKYAKDDCRFFKEFANYKKLPAKYSRRLDNYVSQLESDKAEILKTVKNNALQSALYDIHPTTGEIYQYGTGWIKEELPADLWEQVEALIKTIKKEEEERTADSIKIVDPQTLDDDDHRHELFRQAQEDENCAALAFYLGLTVEELEGITSKRYGYGSCFYECQGVQYYCGTQEEIDEAVQDYIRDSAWAFNPSFLAEQTEIPQEAFKTLCEQCEYGNDGVLAIIEKTCGIESFASSAINEDGWAHFLNSYDGTNDDLEYNGTKYLVCRT